jgi:hypothetical protein
VLPRQAKLLGGDVDADHLEALREQARGRKARAAAQVEHTGPRRQATCEVGQEAIARVALDATAPLEVALAEGVVAGRDQPPALVGHRGGRLQVFSPNHRREHTRAAEPLDHALPRSARCC